MIFWRLLSVNGFISVLDRLLYFAVILLLLIRSDQTMPRGQPDYDNPNYTYFTVETPTSDLFAERLGFSRLDNRGRILWVDDFRNSLTRLRPDADAGGAIPVHVYGVVNAIGYSGSVKIDPLVNGGVSILYNSFLLPVSKRLGMETGIYLSSNFGRVEINLQHCVTQGNGYSASLFINHQTAELYISINGGTHSIVVPSSVGDYINKWIGVKLVADFETGKYERVMIGNTQYDLSSYSMAAGLSGLSGSTRIEVNNEGKTATYKEEIYLGYVVISGDEP
jgi:hypothetical protein